MNYAELAQNFSQQQNVEESTMMGSPCLRYKGDFVAMMFDKAESLIVKLPAERVNELVTNGEGNEFNFTKKRFKEWVLIPLQFEQYFESYIEEALAFARTRND
jgi:hypothetical protein